MSTYASASNSSLQKQCQLEKRSGCAAPQRMPSGHPLACQPLTCQCGLSPALISSRARQQTSARRAWHVAVPSAQLGHGYSSMSRDLLDCWPGCSRASWIEGGADVSLSVHGSASAGGGSGCLAVAAAALAESPAESAETAAPEQESTANSIVRVSCACAGVSHQVVGFLFTQDRALPLRTGCKCLSATDSNLLDFTQICSPEEFEDQLASHGTDLIVLMCKAHSCRPCKVGVVMRLCTTQRALSRELVLDAIAVSCESGFRSHADVHTQVSAHC